MHQEIPFFGRGCAPQRNHLDGDVSELARILDPEAAFLGRGVLLPGGSDRPPQACNQAFARQLQKILAGLARRKFQVRSRAAADLNDVQLVVDDDARGGIFGQHQPVGFPLQVLPGSGFGGFLRGDPPGPRTGGLR